MRKTIILTLTLLVPALSPAQDLRHPWTLQECLDWALEHSLTVKQGELNLAQQEIQANTAENSWLPTVSGSANESINFGRGLTADNTYTSANTTSTGFSIGAGMNLFDGLATPNNIALARLNLEAATKDLERIRDDIRVAVARAYVQVLYDYEIVDVARKQIELDDFSESIPAFLTIILMPLCYSISDGILIGMISYVVINALCGKTKKISVTMWILAILFIARYIFL